MRASSGLGIELCPTFPSARPPGRVQHPCGSEVVDMSADGQQRCNGSNPQSQPSMVSMRSTKGMEGLLLAEVGGSMVQLDKNAGLSGFAFKEGRHIEPGNVTPLAIGGGRALPSSSNHSLSSADKALVQERRGVASIDHGVTRTDTLLNMYASPARKASELKTLLGDSSSKMKHGAVVSNAVRKGKKSPSAVAFEQGKSRARVSIDLVLENKSFVEGGYIAGCIRMHVRSPSKGADNCVSVGAGKIRVAGFEVLPGSGLRHIFYQVSAPLEAVSKRYAEMCSAQSDHDGFALAKAGTYSMKFSMLLPKAQSGGKPKGIHICSSGSMIRYIAIASIKVVDPDTGKRSIAHFYRDCEVWPAFDSMATLAPAPQPIRSSSANKLFMGGDGKLRLTAELHRATWVAGQACHVRAHIENDTKKTVRSLGLALIRTTTLFRPSPRLDTVGAGRGGDAGALDADPDACQTETVEKRIAEDILTAGQKGSKGYASAKGWWTGVGLGESSTIGHCIVIPAEALSLPRSRLLEVEYTLRVNLGVNSLTGSSDAVTVTLPIRIINFISLDAPPSNPLRQIASSADIGLETPRASQSSAVLRSNVCHGEEDGGDPYPRTRQKRAQETLTNGSQRLRKGLPSGLPALSVSVDEIYPAPQHSAQGQPVSSSSSASIPRSHRRRALGPSKCSSTLAPSRTMVTDLGGLEDADELHGVFGCDIPGSASILQESDISLGEYSDDWDSGDDSVDLGYQGDSSVRQGLHHCSSSEPLASARSTDNEQQTRPRSARVSFDLDQRRRHQEHRDHRHKHGQIMQEAEGSDDELEVMIDRASEQIGVGTWSNEEALSEAYSSLSEMSDTSAASYDDDEDLTSPGSRFRPRKRGEMHINTSAGTSRPKSRSVISKDSESPRKHTFAERVNLKIHEKSDGNPVSRDNCHPPQMTPTSTTPSHSSQHISTSQSFVPASSSSSIGSPFSNVRARIAMLEQQSRENQCDAASPTRPTPSRSMTCS